MSGTLRCGFHNRRYRILIPGLKGIALMKHLQKRKAIIGFFCLELSVTNHLFCIIIFQDLNHWAHYMSNDTSLPIKLYCDDWLLQFIYFMVLFFTMIYNPLKPQSFLPLFVFLLRNCLPLPFLLSHWCFTLYRSIYIFNRAISFILKLFKSFLLIPTSKNNCFFKIHI